MPKPHGPKDELLESAEIDALVQDLLKGDKPTRTEAARRVKQDLCPVDIVRVCIEVSCQSPPDNNCLTHDNLTVLANRMNHDVP